MSRGSCWGVFRERAHSPGRESDDAEILRLTGKHLEAKRFEVILKEPEDLTEPIDVPPRFVFLMCEGLDMLHRLRAWETRGAHEEAAERIASYLALRFSGGRRW